MPVSDMAEKYEAQTREEICKVRDWLSKEDPISIATHQKVDADAAFSAALLQILRPHAALAFVRADAKITDNKCLAVDLCEGSRAVKGLGVGSAFGLVVGVMKDVDRPVYDALRRWAKQLNLTDSGRQCNDSVVLAELVSCWRSLKFNDAQIVSRAKELIQGKILSEKQTHDLKESAKSVSIVEGIAVVPKGVRVRAGHLFQCGAVAVIRQSECGQSVMISKKLLKNGASLTELAPLLPEGWFVHQQGFLACFGSVKAPKDYRDSGIKLEDFITIIKTWIMSHKLIETTMSGDITKADGVVQHRRVV